MDDDRDINESSKDNNGSHNQMKEALFPPILQMRSLRLRMT